MNPQNVSQRPTTAPRTTDIAVRRVVTALIAAAGLGLLLFPPGGLPPGQAKALALGVIAIGYWATGVVPEHLTALLFFLLAMLLGAAPPKTIFSGFFSGALWLVYAGLILGVAVKTTGLGERVARRLARRLGGSYAGLIGGVVLVGVFLGFVMPSSMGRVILLIPIALAVAEHFGFERGSNGRTGIVLATAFGSHVPTFAILPANVPNMILVGASETIYSVSPMYGQYLLLHFPVLGLLKALTIVALILWLFPDRPRPQAEPARAAPPVSRQERTLAWVLAAALALWMTDFLHHISPAWVALGAALFLLWPGIDVVTGRQFSRDVNYGSLLFVAGVMGLGAMVSESGLGARLAHELLSVIPLKPGQPALDYLSLTFTSLVTGIVTTLPGVPAVLTPLAGTMAKATGLPLETVLMTQVLGFSTTILPYQSAPLLVGMQMAGERLGPSVRLCLILALLTLAIFLPLDFLWWRLLGWI
jgi:anion transporter